MTPPLLTLTLITTAIPLSVYLIYIIAAITSKPTPPKPLQQLPNISIVIPAYNGKSIHCQRLGHGGTGVVL